MQKDRRRIPGNTGDVQRGWDGYVASRRRRMVYGHGLATTFEFKDGVLVFQRASPQRNIGGHLCVIQTWKDGELARLEQQ